MFCLNVRCLLLFFMKLPEWVMITMCSMSGVVQAPLAASEEPAFARQLANATLDHYGVSSAHSRPPSMPAAVAVVLATCGHHLSSVAASLRSAVVAAIVSQLASAGDMGNNECIDRTATAWHRALAAAEAAAAAGGLNVQPMRGGGTAGVRPTFVSIPELDEDLDLGIVGAAEHDDKDDLVLGPGSPAIKAPTPTAKTLAHAMTKALLGSTLRRNGGSSAVRPQSPVLHCSMPSMTAESAPAPSPPVIGDLATPRGGESEALARLDYDTSQTLTQFSDAEHRTSLAPYVLDGLEGVPPPPEEAAGGGEGTGRGTCHISLRASGHAAAERSSLFLSPRDKSAVQRADLPAMLFIALLANAFLRMSSCSVTAADQNDRTKSRVQGVIRCAEAAWFQVCRCVACSIRCLTKRARQAGSRAAHGFMTPHTHIPSSCSQRLPWALAARTCWLPWHQWARQETAAVGQARWHCRCCWTNRQMWRTTRSRCPQRRSFCWPVERQRRP